MNDRPGSPAPLVEQALQSLRDAALDRTATAEGGAAQTQAPAAPHAPTEPVPETHANPAPRTPSKSHQVRAERDPPHSNLDAAETEVEADAESSVELTQPGGSGLPSLDSAMEALRAVSVSAQTRLADPEDFPVLPLERDLPDLGPYVEHVMRQAQAAAAAYREEAAREAAAHATKLLGNATALAEKIHHDADAYGDRARAQADALLAERVRRIAELTGRLSKMAQLAADEFAGDKEMRDQMMQFISGLTDAAEDAVAEVFPDAAP